MPILAISRLHLIDPSSIEHNSACLCKHPSTQTVAGQPGKIIINLALCVRMQVKKGIFRLGRGDGKEDLICPIDPSQENRQRTHVNGGVLCSYEDSPQELDEVQRIHFYYICECRRGKMLATACGACWWWYNWWRCCCLEQGVCHKCGCILYMLSTTTVIVHFLPC